MRVSRRRRAGTVLAFVMACLAASAGAAGVQAATNPITLSVHAGYQGNIKVGAWMPVSVDATNTGADFDGTLEVSGSYTSQGGPPAFAGTIAYGLNGPAPNMPLLNCASIWEGLNDETPYHAS